MDAAARLDTRWTAAPPLAADPRPGTAALASTVLGELRIELLACSGTTVVARLTPVQAGAATAGELLVLAETAASTAAGISAGEGCRAFGAELDASFPGPPAPGPVRATATPLRLGDSLHTWRVQVDDTCGELVLEGRCTLAIASG